MQWILHIFVNRALARFALDLDEGKRRRTIVRVDAGGGSLDDVNWMLARGYLVHTKDYSGKSANKLAKSVGEWFDDPHVPGRQFGLVTEPALCYVCPVTRIAVRSRQRQMESHCADLSSLGPGYPGFDWRTTDRSL